MGNFSGLGERIRARLRALGYWKRDRPDVLRFCLEKGYRPQYVYAWLRDRVPSRANLDRLAADLDVSMAWVLFGEEAAGLAGAQRRLPEELRETGAAAPPLLDSRRLRDVTERLVLLEGELQAILEAFPDSYVWLGEDGTIAAYKAGRGVALPGVPQDFVGRRIREFVSPEVADGLGGALRKAVDTGAVVGFECRVTVGERERAFEARMVALPTPAGAEPRVLAVVRDMTERKRIEDATRALAHVGRELAGMLDVGVATDRIVSTLVRHFGVRTAGLFRFGPSAGTVQCVAAAGAPELQEWVGRILPAEWSVGGRAMLDNRPLWTGDLEGDPRLRLPEWARRALGAAGIGSAVGIPLVARGEVVGACVLADVPGRTFDGAERELLAVFADQAALAIQNARLYTEAVRRGHEAEQLARSARLLAESLDMARVGECTVTLVEELFRPDGGVTLRLCRPDGALVVFAEAGPSPAPGHVMAPGLGVAGRAVATGVAAQTRDVLADPTLTVQPDIREFYAGTSIRAVLAVPVRARGETIGVLGVGFRQPRLFPEGEVSLVQAFADQVGLALANARLYEESLRRSL